MKKSAIAVCIGLYSSMCGQETKFLGRIVQRAKVPKIAINNEIIQKNFLIRFQNELSNFLMDYRPVYRLLENLNSALITYSNQPLAYQQNYRNVAHFDALINQIKQKNLTVAITKLLQYKTSIKNQVAEQADLLIENLKKVVQDIQTTLAKLSTNNNLFIEFVDNPPAKIAHVFIADYFKNYVSKQFFFRIKKIKRAIINWENKQI